MVTRMKQSTMHGIQVRILRYYIEYITENRDKFLFDMVPDVSYILNLENKVSEKMVVAVLLK